MYEGFPIEIHATRSASRYRLAAGSVKQNDVTEIHHPAPRMTSQISVMSILYAVPSKAPLVFRSQVPQESKQEVGYDNKRNLDFSIAFLWANLIFASRRYHTSASNGNTFHAWKREKGPSLVTKVGGERGVRKRSNFQATTDHNWFKGQRHRKVSTRRKSGRFES